MLTIEIENDRIVNSTTGKLVTGKPVKEKPAKLPSVSVKVHTFDQTKALDDYARSVGYDGLGEKLLKQARFMSFNLASQKFSSCGIGTKPLDGFDHYLDADNDMDEIKRLITPKPEKKPLDVVIDWVRFWDDGGQFRSECSSYKVAFSDVEDVRRVRDACDQFIKDHS